jgi:mannan endo-1,4-beta-mannosidase
VTRFRLLLVCSAALALLLTPPALASRIYWGAWVGPELTGGSPPFDWSAEEEFIGDTRKRPSVVHFYSPFARGCTTTGCNFYPFNTAAFERIRRNGMIPFVSWSSASLPITVRQPLFQNKDVIRGQYNGYIRRWARAAKTWGHPFFLRFDREMNGSWFPWSPGVNGNTARSFRRAWIHVWRIFQRVGATNATWVWCPNVDPHDRLTGFNRVYPGNRYVSWTCLDGYNFGKPWRSFGTTFRRSYRLLTRHVAPTKPLIIGEVGSVEGASGAKAAWIADFLRALPGYPKIEGFLWFNAETRGNRWMIESSSSSQSAFQSEIASPYFAAASQRFTNLTTRKVRPLR